MASSLSNLVNNVSERIHRTKRKFRHDKKKIVKFLQLNIRISTGFLKTQILKMI